MKLKKADIILTISLCSISLATMLILKLIPQTAPELIVFLPSGEKQSYALSELDAARDITVTEDVVIRLQNGKACFLDSDCSDKLCVTCGWIDNTGDYAACLPNKVAICIINGMECEVDVVV